MGDREKLRKLVKASLPDTPARTTLDPEEISLPQVLAFLDSYSGNITGLRRMAKKRKSKPGWTPKGADLVLAKTLVAFVTYDPAKRRHSTLEDPASLGIELPRRNR